MLTPKDPDPRRRKSGITRWQYLAVKNGTAECAFLAGKPTGTWVHYLPRSRPCRAMMTEGKLPCAYCAEGHAPSWAGYTPLYSPEYSRLFVIIKEDHYESVSELELHAQVKVSRAKDQRAPVVIRPSVFRTQPLPFAAERVKPADMMPFLVFTLWKDDALIKWAQGISSTPVPGASASVPLVSDNLVNAITRQADRTAAQAEAARRNEEFVRSLQARQTPGELVNVDQAEQLGDKPTRNGKHKPR